MTATSTTERKFALTLAEGGLWLVLIGGLVGVLVALREITWELTGWNWLLVGPSVPVASLPATLNEAGFGQVQLPAADWIDTVRGTVDAATGLPPVEVGGPVQVQVSFWGMSHGESLARLAPSLLLSVGMVLGSWLLLRIVRSARAGEVFTMRNAIRLRWLAAVIGIGGLVHNALAAWVPNWILSRSAAATYVDTSTFTISFAPVYVGLLIAALAVIWEHGVRLAEDADGLV